MAANSSFKSYYNPVGGAITDNNCVYKCDAGSDSNAGTRTSPVKTLTKALSLLTYTKVNLCFRDKSTENVSVSSLSNGAIYYIFGDDDSAYLNGILTVSGGSATVYLYHSSFRVDTVTCYGGGGGIEIRNFDNMIIGLMSDMSLPGSANISINNSFITEYRHHFGTITFSNNTIIGYKNYSAATTAGTHDRYNSIITEYIDLYPYKSIYTIIPSFKYSVIRKSASWKWNGVIVPITYTTATGDLSADSTQWKTDIFNGMTSYYNSLSTSSAKTYLALLLSNWSIVLYHSTMVVDDINCCPVFNKYDSGSPVDYSLKISNTNPALTMSSVGSYVGAYKASITPIYDLTTLKELDNNGVETSNTADILVLGINGTLYPSPSATQYRNRIKTNVLSYPRGYSFDGIQSRLISGLAAHYNFGKYQSYTTMYSPQESIEVEPHNTPTERGTFPNFSAKLNGSTQMWYNQYGTGTVAITTAGAITGTGTAFTTNFSVGQMFYVGNEGHIITAVNSATSMTVASWSVAVAAGSKYASVPTARINTPLLFSDLAGYYNIISDLNITEYGTWAVTNADFDSYYLYSKTGVQLTNILLKYLKFVVNINYYA